MTAQDIITEIRQICQQTDENNTSADNNVILGWINACTLQLCSIISTLPKTEVPGIVAAAVIAMPSNLLKLDFASISDGSKHSPIDSIDFVNFARLNPNWEDTPAGKPINIVRMTDLSWKLWPSPSAAWIGKDLTLIGTVVPTPLTGFSESPAISISMHPAYAQYGAWKFFSLLNNPERAAMAYNAFDGLRKLNTQTTTSTTGSLLSLKMR